jgi:hypothetical protein
VTATTIAVLNGSRRTVRALPEAQTFAEEFRVYEVMGVVQLTRNETTATFTSP